MSNIGKIKIKNLQDLVERKKSPEQITQPKCDETKKRTPLKRRGRVKSENSAELVESINSTTPIKKSKVGSSVMGTAATTSKKLARNLKKEAAPPSNQKRIDTFFKSCSKSYRVEPEVPTAVTSVSGKENHKKTTTKSSAKKRVAGRTKTMGVAAARSKVRKRLYAPEEADTTETETTTSLSCLSEMPPQTSKAASIRKRKTPPAKTKTPPKKQTRTTPPKKQTRTTPPKKQSSPQKPSVCIDLCSESEEEALPIKQEPLVVSENAGQTTPPKNSSKPPPMVSIPSPRVSTPPPPPLVSIASPTRIPKDDTPPSSRLRSGASSATSNEASLPPPSTTSAAAAAGTRTRQPRPCPAYKIIAGSTLAVDAFQFGRIAGVTHYFLTHFHADHYVGLTRKFAMPLYLSPITARLVRAFIPLEEQYLHEIDLNKPLVVEGVEVTAIDANHCPGAVMLLFKFTTGKCVLHTGDFRASYEMESEPVFWNNDIDTIYLDTTYLSDKYDFCTQWESIDSAKRLVHEFRERHADKRILYVCGSYTIGKEKFWGALAEEFKLTVWTEGNRRKALEAMANVSDSVRNSMLCNSPLDANLHVITMGKLGYLSLVDYFEPFAAHFDILLAIRPSGWEKNSKPKYGKTINILGIEYSEHSSHNEMKRFVSFLKPRDVISTVPVARDLAVTAKVPAKWYKYDQLRGAQRNYQPAITSYLKVHTKPMSNVQNTPKSKLKNKTLVPAVSPQKSCSSPTNAYEGVTPPLDISEVGCGSTDAVLQDSPAPLADKCKLVLAGSTPRHSDAVSDWLS